MSKKLITDPLSDNNPITIQVLGICSALAVTSGLQTAVVMSLSVIAVMCCSSTIISLLRKSIPFKIRIIVQMLVIATFVSLVEYVLEAYAFDQYLLISLFVALIVTNCIVMGRTEGFALQNPPIPAFIDALGQALGYSLILIIVAAFRELLGAGELFGVSVLGDWYLGNGLASLPVGAFLIIGLLIWLQRTKFPHLVEEEN